MNKKLFALTLFLTFSSVINGMEQQPDTTTAAQSIALEHASRTAKVLTLSRRMTPEQLRCNLAAANPKLMELTVGKNSINHGILAIIFSHFKKLTLLQFEDCTFACNSWAELPVLLKLSTLSIKTQGQDNFALEPALLEALITAAPALTSLTISRSPDIDPEN